MLTSGGLPGHGGRDQPGRGTDLVKHTLALVNPGEATTARPAGAGQGDQEGVRAAFGVELASEPVLVGAGL